MRTTLLLAATILAAGTTLTACGEDDDSGSSGSSQHDDQHNEQDVAFATDMIPHHAQAVQMAQVAEDRAGSRQVRDLAADIEAAQGPEIELMSAWLDEWGEDVRDTGSADMGHDMGDMGDTGDMGSHDMDGDASMPGMMSDQDLDRLGTAGGRRFDQMFLTMMIAHHEGAIEMAQTEQADGEYTDAIELAQDIENAQTEEIALMRDLLDR